jgi:hypothetical protein
MQDPDLIKDAALRKLEISPVTGAQVEDLLARASRAHSATHARVKSALGR